MIAALAGQGYDVKRCCRILGVAPSSYFGWHGRPPSTLELRREWLRGLICQIHADSRGELTDGFDFVVARFGREFALQSEVEFDGVEAGVFRQPQARFQIHPLRIGKGPEVDRLFHVVAFGRLR